MRHTISIISLLLCSYSHGQLDKDDDEYMNQSYAIFEITILNELIKYTLEFDSIQVIEGKTIYTVDSNWNALQYPSDYTVKINRKNQKVKSIKTEYFTAEFTYNLFGKIAKIKFNYGSKVRSSFYEGTTDFYEFEYENGRLINCYDYGIYSPTYPFKYDVKYY